MSQGHVDVSNDAGVLKDDMGQGVGQETQLMASNQPQSSRHRLPHPDSDQPADVPQAQANNAEAGGQLQPKNKSTSLIGKIHALKERLIRLEEEAGNQQQPTIDTADVGDTEAAGASEEEKKLRKEIRRARFGRKWVQKTEERADETADDREAQQFGSRGPFMSQIGPGGQPTRSGDDYRNPRDGTMVPEFATTREEILWTYHVTPDPGHNSIRPPASLRPIYSRKLGPHTQWDTSDSEEWSSDGSTRSRDFNYFRARLRGDFEWELDRLNHQRKRYEAHKAKKEKRRLEQIPRDQDAGRDSNGLEDEAFGGADKEDRAIEQHAVPKLNPLEWNMFKAARITQSEKTSFAIDILMGEPKINDYYGYISKQYWARSARSNPMSTAQTSQAPAPTERPDGHSAFPERIRIHSRHIIKTLAVVRGSDLVTSDSFNIGSVVMLRPFRMLVYYEREIREWYSKLAEELDPAKSKPEGDVKAEELENTDDVDEASDTSSIREKKPKVEDPEGYSKSETTLQQLPCLFDFMDRYISERVAHLNSSRCNKIYFSDIWHVFKPGDLVISGDGKQAYMVIKLTSARHVATQTFPAFYAKEPEQSNVPKQGDITIHCVCIQFDGSQLGPVSHAFPIKKYDGEKAVATLGIYPLRFHILESLESRAIKPKLSVTELEDAVNKGVADLRQRLIQRGRRFIEVAAVKHMYYAGLAIDTRDEVESQVMIDFEEAFRSRLWRPTIERLVGASMNSEGSNKSDMDGDEDGCEAICCQGENVHDDSYVENKQQEDLINSMMAEIADNPHKLPSVAIFPRSLDDTKTEYNSLKEDELIIMSYCVFGFVLRDRTWAQLDLDYLSEVTDVGEDYINTAGDDSDEDDKTAFGRLVLPKGHREMVLSLISQHFRNKASQKGRDEQVDIVRGKGMV
ncbi:hypothetical protein N0V84_003621 [Fusarium piperis]|uniref:DUF7025 domain-containing protein n=1 Tax=Fusarium piperis TaxID=1435070 RepID=A0A9W9BQZ1_9HYPO|nr:hypothetical protein N0V84_003621 [Fusarium piperis]